MDTVKIGNFLAQLRREKKYTQEQLGLRLGVTNKTISRWENGNYMPSVEMLQLLRQHRTKTIYNFCTHLACIYSVILHEFSLTYDSMSAENSCNLPKNLTAQYAHNLYAVLP